MLSPVEIGRVPKRQGCWERAYLLERLSSEDFDGLRKFLACYGTVTNFRPRNLVANWAPTYVTCRLDDALVVIIQGTENVRQIVLHLAGVGYTALNNSGGVVNRLWWTVAGDMLDDLAGELLGSDRPAVVDLCGHSYGGAVAALLARRMYARWPDVSYSVCTLGAPKGHAGSTGPYAPDAICRIRTVGDIVPVLPPPLTTQGLRGALSARDLVRSVRLQWERDGESAIVDPDHGFDVGASELAADAVAAASALPVWTTVHPIVYYRMCLEAPGEIVKPEPIPPASPLDREMIEAQPPAPLDPPAPDPSVLDQINRVYFGAESAIVEIGNYLRWETTTLIAGTPVVRRAVNIGGVIRGSGMAVYSGYTKITMCINNSRFGRLESHVCNVRLDDRPALNAAILALITARINLLGSEYASQNLATKKPGTPQIQFYKVQDAFYPKQGYVIDLTGRRYFAPTRPTAYPADTSFTALSMRFVGEETFDFPATAPLIAQTRSVSLQVNVQPDDAVQAGVFDTTFARDGIPFNVDLQTYASFFLTPSSLLWGFIGLSSRQPRVAITGWQVVVPALPAQPYWTFTTEEDLWVSGDRVRITGVNPNFNGTFFVTRRAAGVWSMKNAPATGRPAPLGGFARRVGAVDGSRTMGFYHYVNFTPASGPSGYPQVKVTKKNPGREFLNQTFRGKPRKLR